MPCVFSPVSASSTPNSSIILKQKKKLALCKNTTQLRPTPVLNQWHNSILSLDSKGFCTFEKHTNFVYNHMTFVSSMNTMPNYSQQFKQDLFHIYFANVHPFFPILDRFYTLQSIDSLPISLQWSIIAVALHFTENQFQDAHLLAATFCYHASIQLDQSSDLFTAQTLLLLYKFHEIITPIGAPISTVAIDYLKQAQHIIQQQQNDELYCRVNWILFITITLGSAADERWRNLQNTITIPTRYPTITEPEQYDKDTFHIISNLVHLSYITVLYSKIVRFVQEKGTLFTNAEHPEFASFASDLNIRKSSLTSHIASSLSADPPHLYSAQNRPIDGNTHDASRTTSFTSYFCLIYDILDLLVLPVDISKKALYLSYRAHSLTIGDMYNTGRTRLACIQGSRIVSYGLTLAIQAQVHYLHQLRISPTLEDTKKLRSICSLSFQIMEDMKLSSELRAAIRSLHNQTISAERIKENTPMTTPQENQLGGTQDINYYFYTMNLQADSKPVEQSTPQQQSYYSYSSTEDGHTTSSSNYQWNQEYSSSYHQNYDIGHIPITPTLTQEFQPSFLHPMFSPEPVTPPNTNMDSYFQPHTISFHYQAEPTITIASPGFSLISLSVQNSKCCKNYSPF